MTDKIQIAIKLLDRTYHIQCAPSEQPILEQAASLLSDRLKSQQDEIKSSFTDVLVISALNLSKELLVQSESNEQTLNLPRRIIEKLQLIEHEVNQVLAG